MVRREYARKNITLPAKFWNLQPYKASYCRQMQLASKLVRAYGEQAVQNVIDRETWAFSLAPKKFPEMMEIEANRLAKLALVEKITQDKKDNQPDMDGIPVWRSPNK